MTSAEDRGGFIASGMASSGEPAPDVPPDVRTIAATLRISPSLLADAVSRRPGSSLRDLMPAVATSPKAICYHEYPDGDSEARENRGFICPKCQRMFVAQKVRPPRKPAETCSECGHSWPKGPKPKKVWTWVEVKPA